MNDEGLMMSDEWLGVGYYNYDDGSAMAMAKTMAKKTGNQPKVACDF